MGAFSNLTQIAPKQTKNKIINFVNTAKQKISTMATATKTVDTRIMNRLKVLDIEEKEAVLTIVDKLAKAHEDEWKEEEKAELDELKLLHRAGKLKSYTVAEVRKHALKAIKK